LVCVKGSIGGKRSLSMQTTVGFRATEEGGTCRHVYILGLVSSTSAQAADSEYKNWDGCH
jgi:hypothetical protein